MYLHDIESLEHAQSLRKWTEVHTSVNPSAWGRINHHEDIVNSIQERSPGGWQHVQLDGLEKWVATIHPGSVAELIQERDQRLEESDAEAERIANER